MSGSPKNTEKVSPGEAVTLDIYFKNYSGGTLTDPSPAPTYVLTDPDGATLSSGTGTKISTGYYQATYVTSSVATVSDTYKIEWTAYVNSTQVPNAWEYWRVVPSGSAEYDDVVISDEWLNQIKKILMYPLKDNVLLTDAEIKEYCVKPALDEYSVKFPYRESAEYSYSTSSETEIDFPDAATYGVVDARIVGKGFYPGTGSSYWDLVAYNSIGGGSVLSGNGTYGRKFGYNPNGLKQQYLTKMQEAATMNNISTSSIRIDDENRKVYVFANASGKANITWAKYSRNFENVRFVYKHDVVRLAQSYLLFHLADAVGLVTSNSEITVNVSDVKSRADELRTKVMEKFDAIPDVIVIRQT